MKQYINHYLKKNCNELVEIIYSDNVETIPEL